MKLTINKSNIRNIFLDGKLDRQGIIFLPYFNFDLDLKFAQQCKFYKII